MNQKNLLTIPEVAPILRVSLQRCYEMARTGILPVVRLGRQLRIDREKLAEWINGGGRSLDGGWRARPQESTASSAVGN